MLRRELSDVAPIVRELSLNLRRIEEMQHLGDARIRLAAVANETGGSLSAGVPASIIQQPSDQLNDPHLISRDAFVEIDHPAVGRRTFLNGNRFNISGLPERIIRTPLLGEHNDEIYLDLLGMAPERYSALKETGVISSEPAW